MTYAYVKLFLAVLTLAESEGTPQERLAAVFRGPLIALRDDDVPEVARADFRILREQVTQIPAKGDEGTIVASTALMGLNQVRRAFERLIMMYGAAAREEDAKTFSGRLGG